MKIIIETIDHKDQKYDTIGDYWTDPDGTWQIRVSKMGNWKYEMAVALHELWEKSLCYDRHIGEEFITQFDIEFEKDEARKAKYIEPGNDPDCPYKAEHEIAESVARMMCTHLGIDYELYNNCM